MNKPLRVTPVLWTALMICFPQAGFTSPAEEIDIRVDAILESFAAEIAGAEEFLQSAKGVLVFPSIVKAGFVFGAEYGEGALRIESKSVQYYSVAGISFGFQLGAQAKSQVILFMQQEALDKFRASQGWEVGVDGSVAIAEFGTGGSIDTTNMRDPIVAFIFNNRGLMFNVTLEGSKFTKILR